LHFDEHTLKNLKVTIMGLGLHGGGVASARFFASRGSEVTVTDLRSRDELQSSLEALRTYPIRYVLGEHHREDFSGADLVIKNPAVPASSPYLEYAKRIETDISVFLRLNPHPVIAITGSKGKSTVASATASILQAVYPQTRLGGNITVSPLTFLDDDSFLHNSESGGDAPVVLELSSWQLADLEDKEVLKPVIAAITIILPDHMNRYASMDDYIYDKSLIYQDQTPSDFTVLNRDDPVTPRFEQDTQGTCSYFSAHPLPHGQNGAWLTEDGACFRDRDGNTENLLPQFIPLPGEHNRINLLCSALIAKLYGASAETIRRQLRSFHGIHHRLELVREIHGISFYNDSAATIPEATLSAVRGFDAPIILIAGGTDKKLDFSLFREILPRVKLLVLLAGSATEKIEQTLQGTTLEQKRTEPAPAPFTELREAVSFAYSRAHSGDIILLSPGCASFEMFANEFDRGDQFKAIVKAL
jgi:UDP-N-acetylmuramoylalanine--D-glutamate ligase